MEALPPVPLVVVPAGAEDPPDPVLAVAEPDLEPADPAEPPEPPVEPVTLAEPAVELVLRLLLLPVLVCGGCARRCGVGVGQSCPAGRAHPQGDRAHAQPARRLDAAGGGRRRRALLASAVVLARFVERCLPAMAVPLSRRATSGQVRRHQQSCAGVDTTS